MAVMALSAEEFQEKLLALKASYRDRLPVQLEELEALAAPVIEGYANPENLAAVHALAHKLGGSSGTFGFAAFSAAAHDIEAFMGAHLQGDGQLPETERLKFGQLLEALKQADM